MARVPGESRGLFHPPHYPVDSRFYCQFVRQVRYRVFLSRSSEAPSAFACETQILLSESAAFRNRPRIRNASHVHSSPPDQPANTSVG